MVVPGISVVKFQKAPLLDLNQKQLTVQMVSTCDDAAPQSSLKEEGRYSKSLSSKAAGWISRMSLSAIMIWLSIRAGNFFGLR